jgi:hypothetical protein
MQKETKSNLKEMSTKIKTALNIQCYNYLTKTHFVNGKEIQLRIKAIT